jgi:hypothetical protein
VSNLQPKSFAGEGSTQFPRFDSFHNNRPFFNGKDAGQISIHRLTSSAPGAARVAEALAWSKLRPDFPPFTLIRSNLQPIYQAHLVQNYHQSTWKTGRRLSNSSQSFHARSNLQPIFGQKRRKFSAHTAREFTTIEYRDCLLEPFFREKKRHCSLFAPIAHSWP